MKDVFIFIKQGWNNIWKQDIVWLFSAFPVLVSVLGFFRPDADSSLLWMFLYLLLYFILLALSFVSLIGVPYIVYSSLIGKVATVQDTLFTARKLAWRFIGCSCLGLLLFSPLLFLIFGLFVDTTSRPIQFPNSMFLIFSLFSVFGAIWPFCLAGFLINDSAIGQTVKVAWNTFADHFWVLAILGVFTATVFRVWNILAGISTVLIQMGFDMAALYKLNYLNLSQSLGENILFVVLSGIGSIIFVPFSDSVFITAYLKYNDGQKA